MFCPCRVLGAFSSSVSYAKALIPIVLTYRVSWNSALSETVPMSTMRISVVTPEFLLGDPFDVAAARKLAAARLPLPVSGLNQVTGRQVNTTLSASWGSVGWELNSLITNDSYYEQTQKDYKAAAYKLLTRLECLNKYQDIAGKASDGLLVSTWDQITETDPRYLSDNSLLWSYGAFGVEGPGNYWLCGNSNDFDCRKPHEWDKDPALIRDWNVFGYRYRYPHESV